MTQTKLIPADVWASLPELDLTVGADLFPQVAADTYRPVRSDVASAVIPQLTAGSIDQAAPTIGDTLTVSGSNAPVGATFQWQREGLNIAGATGATLTTSGLAAGLIRRQVSAGAQGPFATPEVQLVGAAGNFPAPFGNLDWDIQPNGVVNQVNLTIAALPASIDPIQIIQVAVGTAPFAPEDFSNINAAVVSGGNINATGTYVIDGGLFPTGSARDVALRAVSQDGPGVGSDVKSVTAGAPAPSVSSLSLGAQGSDGVLPLTINGLTADAPDSFWILTTTTQTTLTSAQVRAGTDENDGPAADAGAVDLSFANLPATVQLSDGLDATLQCYVVLGNGAGGYSAPIHAGGRPIDTTAPVLSGLTVSDVTAIGASWSVTSDEAGGTIYLAVRDSASPDVTVSDLINGGSEVEASSREDTPTADSNNGGSFGGLTAATSFVAHALQIDEFGNQSDIVTSAPFTTGMQGAAAPTVTDIRFTTDDSPQDGGGNYYHEFTNVSFGPATPNRRLSVLIVGEQAGFANAHNFSASTIGGQATTAILLRTSNGEASLFGVPGVGAIAADVPDGASGTVRIDFGDTFVAKGTAIMVVCHSNALTTSVLSYDNDTNSPVDLSGTVAEGAYLFGAAVNEGNAGAVPISWTGLTAINGALGWTDNTDIRDDGVNNDVSFASAGPVSAGPRTITATTGGTALPNNAAALVLEIV